MNSNSNKIDLAKNSNKKRFKIKANTNQTVKIKIKINIRFVPPIEENVLTLDKKNQIIDHENETNDFTNQEQQGKVDADDNFNEKLDVLLISQPLRAMSSLNAKMGVYDGDDE